jgi:hypothetical protein
MANVLTTLYSKRLGDPSHVKHSRRLKRASLPASRSRHAELYMTRARDTVAPSSMESVGETRQGPYGAPDSRPASLHQSVAPLPAPPVFLQQPQDAGPPCPPSLKPHAAAPPPMTHRFASMLRLQPKSGAAVVATSTPLNRHHQQPSGSSSDDTAARTHLTARDQLRLSAVGSRSVAHAVAASASGSMLSLPSAAGQQRSFAAAASAALGPLAANLARLRHDRVRMASWSSSNGHASSGGNMGGSAWGSNAPQSSHAGADSLGACGSNQLDVCQPGSISRTHAAPCSEGDEASAFLGADSYRSSWAAPLPKLPAHAHAAGTPPAPGVEELLAAADAKLEQAAVQLAVEEQRYAAHGAMLLLQYSGDRGPATSGFSTEPSVTTAQHACGGGGEEPRMPWDYCDEELVAHAAASAALARRLALAGLLLPPRHPAQGLPGAALPLHAPAAQQAQQQALHAAVINSRRQTVTDDYQEPSSWSGRPAAVRPDPTQAHSSASSCQSSSSPPTSAAAGDALAAAAPAVNDTDSATAAYTTAVGSRNDVDLLAAGAALQRAYARGAAATGSCCIRAVLGCCGSVDGPRRPGSRQGDDDAQVPFGDYMADSFSSAGGGSAAAAAAAPLPPRPPPAGAQRRSAGSGRATTSLLLLSSGRSTADQPMRRATITTDSDEVLVTPPPPAGAAGHFDERHHLECMRHHRRYILPDHLVDPTPFVSPPAIRASLCGADSVGDASRNNPGQQGEAGEQLQQEHSMGPAIGAGDGGSGDNDGGAAQSNPVPRAAAAVAAASGSDCVTGAESTGSVQPAAQRRLVFWDS